MGMGPVEAVKNLREEVELGFFFFFVSRDGTRRQAAAARSNRKRIKKTGGNDRREDRLVEMGLCGMRKSFENLRERE
ncbi:hypothetical protein ACOSQ2_021323 [Xanthoceras sorbifolium]